MSYLQSADIVFVTLTHRNSQDERKAKCWAEEIIASNIGNLRGIVFLIDTGSLSPELIKGLQDVRRRFEFHGAIFSHVLPRETSSGRTSYANFMAVAHMSISYVLKSYQESQKCMNPMSAFYVVKRGTTITEGDRSDLHNCSYVDLPSETRSHGKDCCGGVQHESHAATVHYERTLHNEVMAVPPYELRYERSHSNVSDSHSSDMDDDYHSVKTSVWDFELLENLHFSLILFIQSLLNMTILLYAFTISIHAFIRFCIPGDCRRSSRPASCWVQKQSEDVHLYYEEGKKDWYVKQCLRSVWKEPLFRSFWGAPKGMFARNPWFAATLRITSGAAVAAASFSNRGCRTRLAVFILWSTHILIASLFGVAQYMSVTEAGGESGRELSRAVAHQYITLYIATCILYSLWSATYINSKQSSRVRQSSPPGHRNSSVGFWSDIKNYSRRT